MALDRFVESVTETFVPDPNILTELKEAAEEIAAFTKSRGAKVTAGHISLACAADYDYTVKDGGRASDIIDSVRPILTQVPLEDEEIKTPLGVLKCPANEERWRHWFRKYPYTKYTYGKPDYSRFDVEDLEGESIETKPEGFYHVTTPFGDPIPKDKWLGEPNIRLVGIDYAFGLQVYACAFLKYTEYREKFIPMRLSTVNEPGYKSRVITITLWWVNVLLQAVSHIVQDCLACHPFAVAGLTRSSQAWNCMYQVQRKRFHNGSSILCSDLKEATDHIPWEVAYNLLSGFNSVFKIPGMNTALDLISMPRSFAIDEDNVIMTTRGIMMGEPLTKSILTLHQLAAEHMAWQTIIDPVKSISYINDARFFSVGGDDIIAAGIIPYLEEISKNLVRQGAKLSDDKHGIFNKVAKYCERILETQKFLKGLNVWSVYKDYDNSAWIESVKVRLLSPTTKSTEVVNDRNTAIGKALSLGKELRYIPDSVYPYKFKNLIRDRFIQRMGSLVPDRTKCTFWHLLLPRKYGGLDLWLEGDIPDLCQKLPDPTKVLLQEVVEGKVLDLKLSDFQRIPRNSSFRGYSLQDSLETRIDAILTNLGFWQQFEISSWQSLKPQVENKETPQSDVVLASQLRKAGWLLKGEVVDQLLRPILFSELVSGKAKPKPYNTERLVSRYRKIWNLYPSEGTILKEETLRAALKKRLDESFFNVSVKTPSLLEHLYVDLTVLEEVSIGTPNLRLDLPEWLKLLEVETD